MRSIFNECLLDFCITEILWAAPVVIVCIGWLIKVTDNNDARWKPEIENGSQFVRVSDSVLIGWTRND